jgi:hypothetical protein
MPERGPQLFRVQEDGRVAPSSAIRKGLGELEKAKDGARVKTTALLRSV